MQEPDPAKAAEAGVTAKRYMATPDAGQLANFAKLIDTGQVVVTVAKVFDLDEAVAAQRFLEEGVPVPWFGIVQTSQALARVAIERGSDLVIKPVDSRGSRGQRETLDRYHEIRRRHDADQ